MVIDISPGMRCIDSGYIRPQLACYYMLQDGDEIAFIDTGTRRSLPALLAFMQNAALRPEQVRYVIPTHVHLDHAGGAGAMMSAFPCATLVVHPKGAKHLIDPEKLRAGTIAVYGEAKFRELYGSIEPVDPARVLIAEDGHRIQVGARALEFRDTPGHADHHFCIWEEASESWFSGDVFGISYPEMRFSDGDMVIPTTTPVQFNPDKLLASIKLLMSYKPCRIQLTHFSAVDNPAPLADLLCRQIEDYRQIALRCVDAADRPQVLRDELMHYSLSQLRHFKTTCGENFYRELFDFDMDLNAQGLDVWLARQAKQ